MNKKVITSKEEKLFVFKPVAATQTAAQNEELVVMEILFVFKLVVAPQASKGSVYEGVGKYRKIA